MNAPRKRLDGRATMDRVVEFARAELAAHGPVDFNLDRVIAESGVSRGSIYHHFGSRAGLITAVEIDDLVTMYREANDVTRRAVESASSGRELLDLLALTFQLGANEIGRNSRSRRIATLVASENIPALHEFLRDRQREGIAYYVETLEIACSRGLLAPTMALDGIANLIQSLAVGRVLVDILEDDESDRVWVETTMALLRVALNPVD